jgi:hypothetical protein
MSEQQPMNSSRTRQSQGGVVALEREQQDQIRQFIMVAGEQPINMRKLSLGSNGKQNKEIK